MNITLLTLLKSEEHSHTVIQTTVDMSNRRMMHRTVTLCKGRYAGRQGIISDVVPCRRNGLLYLIMVYRKNGREVLNSDGASRSYRPLSDFEMIS